MVTRLERLLLVCAVRFVAVSDAFIDKALSYMRIINEFDVSGTIHQFCMYGLFGVRAWCKWALESDSP